jgi:hypothetical protein
MVVFQPKRAGNKINEDSLTRGEAIKKAKVTPSGIPALKKPIKSGIEEQEQNGVTTPKSAANK